MNRLSSISKQLIILLSWSLFFTASGVFSQANQEDLLLKEIKTLQGEDFFIKSNDLAEIYLGKQPIKAQDYAEELLLNKSIENFPEEHARSYYIKGRAISLQGKYNESLIEFDKALTIFNQLKDENAIAKCLIGKGIAYTYIGKYDESRAALTQALNLNIENDIEAGIALAYHELGYLEYSLRNLSESIKYYIKSITICEDIDDKQLLSDNYFRIGIAYYSDKDESKALKNYTNSRAIKEEIGDMIGLARVNISLGIFHEEKGNFQTALDYYQQSLKANSSYGDSRINSVIYNNIGILYEDWSKLDSAVVYHEKALDIRKQLKNERGIAQSFMNIGEAYKLKKNPQEALRYYNSALETSNAASSKPMFAHINDKIGQMYLDLNDLDNAETYLNTARQSWSDDNNYFSLGRSYKNLSALSEKQGDYKKSLDYYKQYKTVQDSLARTRKNRELAEVQAKYDTARQEKEIDELQQENKSRRLWQNIYAVGGLLALILTVITFQFFRFRSKRNKELLAIKENQRQQLEEVNQLKTRFFNNISHEFRTPLTLILGPLQKLKETVDSGSRETVDIIERNGKRLLKLINQLLDISKIEDGKVALKTSHIDVVPLLKGWTNAFNSLAEIKNVKLSFKSNKDAHYLYVDQEKLEKIFNNLLSNAIKHTQKKGNVVINIDETLKGDKNQLSIEVSDTGSGIPQEELSDIFNRFYQASNSNTQDAVGTGIGLALVKELTELHKGAVEVESEMGKGSTFKIFLPFGKAHLSEDEILLIPPTQKPTIESKPLEVVSNEEIPTEVEDESLPLLLLIEDNEDLRTYIKSVLKDHYTIKEAIDGKQGVAEALELIPDIIISDLMMPKMDGFEVCKTLKEDVRTSHIPIILLTARSSDKDKIEGLKSLADDYLTKPFNNEELLVRIENLVAVRSKMQQHFSTGDLLMPKKVKLSSIDQDFIKKVTEVLETEIANENFGVTELSDAVALSRSQLFRKIKAITNFTPLEFIRSFRLHRAMDMLQQQSGTIAEIAYSVGFQNPSYFSKCFQEQFGKLPSDIS